MTSPETKQAWSKTKRPVDHEAKRTELLESLERRALRSAIGAIDAADAFEFLQVAQAARAVRNGEPLPALASASRPAEDDGGAR